MAPTRTTTKNRLLPSPNQGWKDEFLCTREIPHSPIFQIKKETKAFFYWKYTTRTTNEQKNQPSGIRLIELHFIAFWVCRFHSLRSLHLISFFFCIHQHHRSSLSLPHCRRGCDVVCIYRCWLVQCKCFRINEIEKRPIPAEKQQQRHNETVKSVNNNKKYIKKFLCVLIVGIGSYDCEQ